MSNHERLFTRRAFLQMAGVSAAVAAMPGRLVGQGVPQTRMPVKIGIIGSGRQGGALGLQFARVGHEVFFSSRNPESLEELVAKAGPKAQAGTPDQAAKFGDVILLAVPYGATPQIGKDYGALLKGKIVIDVGNPRVDRDGPMAKEALAKGAGVATAEYIPGARIVRALNALSFVQVQNEAHRTGEKLGIPIAGDDKAAVDTVARLVADIGMDPVIVGPLASAREFDAGTPVYVKGMTAQQLRVALGLEP